MEKKQHYVLLTLLGVVKNLVGILVRAEVSGPPNPRSSRSCDGSTLRDIKMLSTLPKK